MSKSDDSPHSKPAPQPEPHRLDEVKRKKRGRGGQQTLPETPVSLLQELRRKSRPDSEEESE